MISWRWAALAMAVATLGAIACTRAAGPPPATPSPSPGLEKLGPPILTEAQAAEAATTFAASSERNGRDLRVLGARLMTRRQYEDQITGGRSYGDRSLPVWIVALEGTWQHNHFGPPEAPRHGVAMMVVDARTGRDLGDSGGSELSSLQVAKGLDPDAFARYPLEVSLSYAADVVDFPVSVPGYLPEGFPLERVTLDLAHPLQETFRSSWSRYGSFNPSVILHYSDGRGHSLQVAESRPGQSLGNLPGAELTTMRSGRQFKGAWHGQTPAGATWLGWTAAYPNPKGQVTDVTYVLHSPDGFVSLDVLQQVAESLPKSQPPGPTATPAKRPAEVVIPTATPMATAAPAQVRRQVTIAPGMVLESYSSDYGGLLYTRDGQVTFDGDGTVNYCYFHTEEGRRDLESFLADEGAMQRVRAYLKEWGLSGRRLQLPHALSMRGPAQVQPGIQAVLSVIINSNSDCPVEYTIGKPAFDFAVCRLDGAEVWRWSRGREVGESTTLRLGRREERAFEATWDLRDNAGRPLPEGAYWVQGYLNIGVTTGQEPAPVPVGRRLLFIGPPLPLTHWLDVSLEAPPTAKLRDSVPLALKVRNDGNEPVELYYGAAAYDFVVLTRGGTEVWRWSRWRFFEDLLNHTTIQPGQALTFTATWDQHDQDCQPDPGVYGRPCQGKPVPPGEYLVQATFEAALDSYVEYKEIVQPASQELTIKP